MSTKTGWIFGFIVKCTKGSNQVFTDRRQVRNPVLSSSNWFEISSSYLPKTQSFGPFSFVYFSIIDKNRKHSNFTVHQSLGSNVLRFKSPRTAWLICAVRRSAAKWKRENAKEQFYGHPRDWPWPWICNLVAKIANASKHNQIDRVIHSSSISKGGQFDRVRCKLTKFQKIITLRPRGGDHGNLPPSFSIRSNIKINNKVKPKPKNYP